MLAAAGLKRLGLAGRIRQVFEPQQMLPAAGQGALGIEVRSERADLLRALAPLAHHATWLAVAAERAVSRAMGGSCSMPLAAHAHARRRSAAAAGAPGATPSSAAPLVRAQVGGTVGSLEEAAALGTEVAARLRAGGAH